LVRYSCTGCATTEDDDTQVTQLIASDMKTSIYCRETDTTCPLNVIVEASQLRLVFIQYSPGILEAKVFLSPISKSSGHWTGVITK
jgi:hypothetical protein